MGDVEGFNAVLPAGWFRADFQAVGWVTQAGHNRRSCYCCYLGRRLTRHLTLQNFPEIRLT